MNALSQCAEDVKTQTMLLLRQIRKTYLVKIRGESSKSCKAEIAKRAALHPTEVRLDGCSPVDSLLEEHGCWTINLFEKFTKTSSLP